MCRLKNPQRQSCSRMSFVVVLIVALNGNCLTIGFLTWGNVQHFMYLLNPSSTSLQSTINYFEQTILISRNLFETKHWRKQRNVVTSTYWFFSPIFTTIRSGTQRMGRKTNHHLLFMSGLKGNRTSKYAFTTLCCLLSFENNSNSIKPTYDFYATRWKTLFFCTAWE